MLTDLTHLTYSTDATLELGMILGPVECALLIRGTTIDGRVAGGTYVELSKLIKLDLDGIVRVAFALRFVLLGLK